MAKHFADSFNRHSIAHGNSRSEGVPRHMECDIFLEPTGIGDFLQIGIHFLV